MKRLFGSMLAALALCSGALAAGGGIAWDKFPKERVTNLAALQNGAKLFVNNCLNCHSAAYMRYNRLTDIGLTEAQIKQNLLFAGDKVGDLMTVAITAKDAKEWCRLSLHLHAHLLPRRIACDRMEQPRLPQCSDAACSVGIAG